MNFLESFKNKTILIPLLQRDYVQGSADSAIISPFLDSLLEKDCDLNYIYGYEEDGCFVPVDGQQRLTTLWLLHLYLFAKKHKTKEYNVHMKFASREYAEDFCERLYNKLEDLLPIGLKYKSLDEAIKDQNWFINSWNCNATVRNMLRTLKLIDHKIQLVNFDIIWHKLVENAYSTITFAFLHMDEGNGLDDDIYIKMNGRGRKLSAFENLKSWMDEKVNNLTFAIEWKSLMDNEWTNLFWHNRNLGQEHPEEIDDEELFFFYNLIILYQSKTGELQMTISDMKDKDPYIFEELHDFLKLDANVNDKELVSGVIDKLQQASNFPILWFERLGLMSSNFLEFAFSSLQKMVEFSKEFNLSQLYIGVDSNEQTTRTYQISMCEGSFNRTLPLLYAFIAFKKGETPFFDWMRTMRNLILNTDIGRDKLGHVTQNIDTFSNVCQTTNIYDLLREEETLNMLCDFDKNQRAEEKIKADNMEYYKQMTTLENGAFFRGHISVLFRMLLREANNIHDKLTHENADMYISTLLEIFDGSEGGIATKYEEDFLLRRALMTFKPYFFGLEKNRYWSFCYGLEEWREYVDSNDSNEVNGVTPLYCLFKPKIPFI